MEPLLGQRFPSFQAARAACDELARARGYALVIAAKKPNAAEPSYVYLRCSKGRKYVARGNEDVAKRRRTSTQMTQCPFRLVLKLDRVRACWLVSRGGNGAHNHPFIEPMAHAKYKGEVVSKHSSEIVQLYRNGLRPAHITARLRSRSDEDPELAGITAKQVHNAIVRHRQEELAGRASRQSPACQPHAG